MELYKNCAHDDRGNRIDAVKANKTARRQRGLPRSLSSAAFLANCRVNMAATQRDCKNNFMYIIQNVIEYYHNAFFLLPDLVAQIFML
jgi:hypothetical protein